jgi:kumamolisin
MLRHSTRGTSWTVAALMLGPVILLPGLLVLASPGSPGSVPIGSLPGYGRIASASSPGPGPAGLTVAPAFVPPPGTVATGPIGDSTPLTVAVELALSDPSGLSALLAAEYAPGGPSYRAFETPAALTAQFGPSVANVAQARAYFEGFGLSVTAAPHGLILLVQGPSSKVGAAFGTSFEQYRDASGRVFVSHPTAARLPAGIPWEGALGLGNVTPIAPAAARASAEDALSGPAAACAPALVGLSPCDVETAYAAAPLIANGTDGSGEKIGIVDAYAGAEPQSELESDFASFATDYGLSQGGVQYLYPVPTGQNLNASNVNTGWGFEEALDLEWARAAAPGATIDMTFSPDAGAGLYAAVDALVGSAAVRVISLSWGEPDTGVLNAFSQPCFSSCNASTDGSYALLSPVLEFAAAEGISVFAASGDCGAADGTSGLSTHFPASDPYVTGVGGTALTVGTGGAWLGETGWNGTASGASAPGCVNQGGSGGGFSPFPRPWWQVGLASNPTARGVPDVALDASTSVAVIAGGQLTGAEGTSVATPIWAGFTAVADQRAGGPLGFLNPSLYRIAASANYSRDFHDITVGSNGYAAGVGWDPVTGLGSPILDALANDLAASPSPTTGRPDVYLFASPRFGAVPLTVKFGVEATGGTGSFPLESVSFGDGNASLASGPVSHTYRNAGVYAAEAWAVDSSGNGSASSPLAIVVGGGTALSVHLAVSNPLPAVGTAITFTATVSAGTAPYTYNYSFGDGTSLGNSSATVVTHAFGAPGGFCAEVVVEDAALPPDGGASNRVAVAVGGATMPDCGNASTPLTVVPTSSGAVRDAPAEFPSLFNISGGAAPPTGLADSLQYSTNDSYLSACRCTILRAMGNYTVRAWVNDTVNEQASAVTNVTVAPPLIGAFAVSHYSGVAPLSVQFFATSHGGYLANPNNTVWSFGDGTGAVGHSVDKTYLVPGEYWAVGRLSDAGHGNTSEAFLVDVLPPGPPLGYGLYGSISPAVDVLSGTTVEFTAGVLAPSGGFPLAVSWDLGPGLSAFGQGANQTYFGPLPAPRTNSLNGTIEAILPNTVTVDSEPFSLAPFFAVEAGGFAPRASALTLSSAVGPALGFTPLGILGNATVNGPGGGFATWTFGDGSGESGNPVTHTYYAADDYTVQVTGHDVFGDRAVDSHEVVANGPLQVFGGPTPSEGTPPLTVSFLGLGVGGTGPPYTYRWTFSGGLEENGSHQTMTYRSLGFFSATLLVTDNSGESATRTWTVNVHPAIVLTAAQVIEVGVLVGLALVGAERVNWFRRRPGRPTLSQRRAAEAVRRVV